MTEFAVPTPLEWREAAVKALKERPLESLIHLDADHLATKPLYGAANGGEPVFAPRPSDSEGRAWDVRALNEGEDADVGDQEAGDQFTATLARHVEDEHQQGDGHDIGEHQIRIHGGTFRVMSSCVNHSVRRSLVPSMTHLCVAYEPVVPIGLGRREDH